MNEMIKNVSYSEKFNLIDLTEYEKGNLKKVDLMQEEKVIMKMLALAAGDSVPTHSASGNALIYILEGEVLFTIDDNPLTLCTGNSVAMTTDAPHSLKAITDVKVLVTIIKK